MSADDYVEPLEAERVWYRHRQTGDRGYAVTREGRSAIRRDRPAQDDYTFNVEEWQVEVTKTDRFSPNQIAQVQFEADKKLCWALGFPELSRRDWLDMSEKQRIKWQEDGPRALHRAKLFAAIGAALLEVGEQ